MARPLKPLTDVMLAKNWWMRKKCGHNYDPIHYITDICDALADPAGGSVNITVDGPTSKASYRCDIGYTLVGVKERYCLNGGSWDSTEPTCGI